MNLLAILIFVFILPSLVALGRCHRNLGPILIVNLLLGGAGFAAFGILGGLLVWAACLAWSLSAQPEPVRVRVRADQDAIGPNVKRNWEFMRSLG